MELGKEPGVQGLVQLGRNAIERVAQLESENSYLRAANSDGAALLQKLRDRIAALEAEKAERERELGAVKSVLHDEIDANLAFRDACGASDDEDMPTFCARIVFELRELRTRMAERERQEPVAWAWNDALGCMHAHCGSRRPVWVDGECSDAKRAETSLRPLYAAPPIPRVEQEPVAWVVGIDELAAKIASELARLDGFDPSDEHCGLYDLGWQGNPPEPMGDLFHLDYLPKGEAIAKAIGLPVIAIREPNEEECERIVESATRMLHSGDTFPEIGRRMFNAVREVMK